MTSLAVNAVDDPDKPGIVSPKGSRRQPIIRAFAISAYYSAIIVILCCLIALIGFGAGWRWAWRPIANGRAFHPLSAIAFLSISLAIMIKWVTDLRKPVFVLSGIAIFIGLFRFYGYLIGNNRILDQISPFRSVLISEAAEGRTMLMSLKTATTIILLSAAIMLQQKRRWALSQLLSLLAAFFPLSVLLGYIYGIPSFIADVGLISAVMGTLSAFAVLARTAGKEPLRATLTSALPGPMIRSQLLVIVGFGMLLAMIAARSGYDENAKTLAVETAFMAVLICLSLAHAAPGLRFDILRQSLKRRALERQPLIRDLSGAWDRGELFLVYQPQIRLSSRAVVGVEALVRWQHPRRGLISPNDFIFLAEESGAIIPLGTWVFREACRQAALWKHLPGANLKVAINVSPLQLAQSGGAETLLHIQRESGVEPHDIVIEVTESTLVEKGDGALAGLRKLRAAGMLVAIDDFGTGYSSLSSLRLLPSHYLKIDRSFVTEIPNDEASCMIARSVVGMGQGLGMKVIAEGIESAEQAAFLKQSGCEKAQGYYYGHPMLPDDFLSWLGNRNEAAADI